LAVLLLSLQSSACTPAACRHFYRCSDPTEAATDFVRVACFITGVFRMVPLLSDAFVVVVVVVVFASCCLAFAAATCASFSFFSLAYLAISS